MSLYNACHTVGISAYLGLSFNQQDVFYLEIGYLSTQPLKGKREGKT